VVRARQCPQGGNDAFLAVEMATVTPCLSSLIMALPLVHHPACIAISLTHRHRSLIVHTPRSFT